MVCVITGAINPFCVTVTQKGDGRQVFERRDDCADSIVDAVRQAAYTVVRGALEKFVQDSLPTDTILTTEGQFPDGFLCGLNISA